MPIVSGLNHIHQPPIISTEKVYKVNESPINLPGGTLDIAPHITPPYHEELEWHVVEAPLTGDDDFVDHILDHVNSGKSCCVEGPPGTGKSWMLGKNQRNPSRTVR